MIDMGQADSSLYRKPLSQQHKMSWLWALSLAARRLGWQHYMDVPDEQLDEVKLLARTIQQGEDRKGERVV